MKQKGVIQDLVKNVIHIHNQTITVQPTDPITLLPTAPLISENQKVEYKPTSKLVSIVNSRILLPGQQIQVTVPMDDGVTVSVEPWEQNRNESWPEPHFQAINEGNISLVNSTKESIVLGKEVKKVKL